MNNKTKVITGISGIAIILTTLEIFHVIFSVKEASEPKPEDVFKNAPVYIIQKDSTGKTDTLLMQDYLKK